MPVPSFSLQYPIKLPKAGWVEPERLAKSIERGGQAGEHCLGAAGWLRAARPPGWRIGTITNLMPEQRAGECVGQNDHVRRAAGERAVPLPLVPFLPDIPSDPRRDDRVPQRRARRDSVAWAA